MKGSKHLYLATDPDREGEAISWHIAEILRERGLLKDKALHRVVFTEITPRAIKEAMTHPRSIASDLVDAQQARRAVDRVGAVLHGRLRGIELEGQVDAAAEVEPEVDGDPARRLLDHLAGGGVQRALRHGARNEGQDAAEREQRDEEDA